MHVEREKHPRPDPEAGFDTAWMDDIYAQWASLLEVEAVPAGETEPRVLTGAEVLLGFRQTIEKATQAREFILSAADYWSLRDVAAKRRELPEVLFHAYDEGEILAIEDRKELWLPRFQFQEQNLFGPVHPIIPRVNLIMGAPENSWGTAAWWVTNSEALGGHSPVRVLNLRDSAAYTQLEAAALQDVQVGE